MNSFFTRLAFTALLLVALPTQAITISLNPSTSITTVNSSFDVALVISGLGSNAAPSLGVFDLDVGYNPAILNLFNVVFGDPVLGDQLDLGFGSFFLSTLNTNSVNLLEFSLDTIIDNLNNLQAEPVSPDELVLMRLIDEIYTRCPFYGSRRITAQLNRDHDDHWNRKRIQRLMGIMGLRGVAPGPDTSKPHPEHKIYPYLLRGVSINRINQVWSTDITYIPMAKYKAESYKGKANIRLPVYQSPDTTSSVAFFLEPGQTAEVFEAYEKTIKPGLVRFQKDWKDSETGVVSRAGEVVNFYIYQEGGCYWFWYSQHSQGQLGDGYCPPYIKGTTEVQEAESIKFSHIRTLAGDRRDGWIEVKHLPEGEKAFEGLSLEEQQQSQEQSPEATNLPTPQMQVGDSYVTESINLNNPKLNNITDRTVIAVASNGDFTLTSRNQKSGFTRTIEYTGQWNVKSTRGNTGEGSNYSPPISYFDFPLYPGKQ